MDPVAFEIFGLEIRWYGILIASGVLIGTILASRKQGELALMRIDFRFAHLGGTLMFNRG